MKTALFVLTTSILLFIGASAQSRTQPKPPDVDANTPYYDRQKIDISNIRDFFEAMLIADMMSHADAMFDSKTKWKMTLFQMIRAGSNHHQARSAYQLFLTGVAKRDILAIWSPGYVKSIRDKRIRAAFQYLELASHLPSGVTADTHALLRMHFTDRHIAELTELTAINTIMAVHDQLLPIATDQETLDWARANLSSVGWSPGLNATENPQEQRATPFVGQMLKDAYAEITADWKPSDLAAVEPRFKTDWVNKITGYNIPLKTFDADLDGIEDPFDFYPNTYLKWKEPGLEDRNAPPAATAPFNVSAYDQPYYTPPVVPETKYPFSDRHHFDTMWTRKMSLGTQRIEAYFPSDRAVPLREKWAAFLVYQLSAGCGHCQVHGSYGLYKALEDDYPKDEIPANEEAKVVQKIRDLLDFERSDNYSAAQKAALRLARDAGKLPGRNTAAHIEELRRHYSDREIQEILMTLISGAWLASGMQSQATVTDRTSMAWAIRNMVPAGWRPGVHIGLPQEQRRYFMYEIIAAAFADINSGEVFDSATEWVGVDVPLAVDSDSDGVEDAFDGFPRDPSRWEDTDRDGIEDSKDDDIDGDGIPNSKEVSLGTFPYKGDSDGDGVSDPTELENGTDPVDPRVF